MDDMRNALGDRQGIDEHIMMRELLRRVEMKVIMENHLDAVVRVHYSLPPGKIGLAGQPEPPGDIRGELRMGPFCRRHGSSDSRRLRAHGLRSRLYVERRQEAIYSD